jgi:hypothetical protein
MSATTSITIHSSQFPGAVRHDLLESLRARRVNHKFHYDSVKQTQKWLALHQAYSPTRNDADCRAIYGKGIKSAAEKIRAKCVHVIGLGCGGGQKDTRLLKLLKKRGRDIFYTPCDVSTAMVLVARDSALAVLPEENCLPIVCDLVTTGDLQKMVGPRCCAASDDRQRNLFRHDSEFRAARDSAEVGVTDPSERLFVVQLQSRSRQQLRRWNEKNPAAIR